MSASKHTIYLTKNQQLNESRGLPTNVFMFNENGPLVQSKWIQKNIEQNDGLFIISDHNRSILQEVEKGLLKRNYYIENVNFSGQECNIQINPFDLVSNTSEIHFLFLNILYIMWDNDDKDLAAMSNLLDAFASCVFFMFQNQKEKLNMVTLRKMVYSVRATCQTNDGVVMLSDAIFDQMNDQESMPCKYYTQFKKAAGERKEEVAEKLAKLFDMFSELDIHMMSKTEEDLISEVGFKTAIFVNSNNDEEEHSAKLLMLLLTYFIQTIESHQQALFIVDALDSNRLLISLPHWIKESTTHNMSFIVCADDLASFKNGKEAERFFKNMRKQTSAFVFVHYDESKTLSLNKECIATVLIPSEELNEQDVLL
jgi:hypothetical protein